MRYFKTLIALILFIPGFVLAAIGPQPITPTPLGNATHFVANNGSGTACTEPSPCTIQTAISQVVAGDVVFLRGGTYFVTANLRFDKSGTSGNPIIFESYPGETAIFDGAQLPINSWAELVVTGNYQHFRSLRIRNFPKRGMEINASNIVVEGCEVHDNKLSGIQILSGSNNIIQHNTVYSNSDVGLTGAPYNDGGNANGIAATNGSNHQILNNLVYLNSDDNIDTFKAIDARVAYNVVHSAGTGPNGEGHGIKAGGPPPNTGTIVEYNLAYSNKAAGINTNTGDNITMRYNTTWNNTASFKVDTDSILENNIGTESQRYGGPASIELNNSWQRFGTVAFISTNPASSDFLKPTVGGGFEDIGAYATTTPPGGSLPDVIVTALSYADGVFTSTVENQGAAATPTGVSVAVGYRVNGEYKTWGGVTGPLAAGSSVNLGTNGAPYVIPSGTHTITAWVDDIDRFAESDENNNKLSVIVHNGVVDTANPTVSVTAPADLSTVSGSSVSITANASDDAGVAGVQFKLDGADLGAEVTAAPYSITWDSATVADGSYTLTAVVRDYAGNTATSANVGVTVDNATLSKPDLIVTNLSYADGVFTSTVKNQGNLATSGGNTIVVRYYVDGAFRADGAVTGELTVNESKNAGTDSSPYVIAPGDHIITATVDEQNTTTESNENNNSLSISVTIQDAGDTEPPVVSITAPSAGATVSGSSVTLTATATDNVVVSGVQFQVDGVNVGAEDTSSPYSITWDSLTVVDGSKIITAIATDTSGNKSAVDIPVTVNNGVTALSDLVIAGMTYDAAGNISATIENIGTVDTAATPLDVRFLINGQVVSSGSTAGPLAASTSTVVNGSDYIIPLGLHTVTVEVDYNNTIGEIDETNNTFTQDVNITCSP